ncbi:MAG: shikimate dehydrogenase [Rikenellaceae bacterium]|nr:shikimate dehydrogenase [Rikenellaceae bacterium]MDN5355169.1 shikimate dehydrogenase [Rikenellaceae bacterium]
MLLSVAGYPIAHSLSPVLFNYFSTKYHIPIHYSRIAINNIDEFNKLFDKNKYIFDGFNITYPLKNEIYSIWQQHSDIPSGIKSCNTLICKPNIKIYNTDYLAFRHIINKEIKDKWDQAIILGSGMTAAVCAWQLINYDKPITIFYNKNTNVDYFPKTNNIHYKQLNEFHESTYNKAIIINTLSPLANYDFLPSKISKATAIIDADYRNKPLEDIALMNNIDYIDGYHWLYYQGIEAFKLFTNQANLPIEYDKKWLKTNKYDKIALIGMSGAGKTTVGKLLAKKMNYEFIDLDDLIEKKENKSISQIFADEGEEFFRQLETKMLTELINNDKIVISTGGGIIKNEKNRKFLKNNFFNIFLNVSIDEALERLQQNENRPLLIGNSKDKWQNLYDKRLLLYYQTADYIVNADKNNVDLIYEDIKEIIKK